MWNLPFMQGGNARAHHHRISPHCWLWGRSECCVSLSQPSSMAFVEAVVAGQAPLCHHCHLVLACTRQQLGVTSHIDLASPGGKNSCQCREHPTFWAHQLLDRNPPMAPGDYSDTFLGSVIPPAPLHHTWGVSEQLTMQASHWHAAKEFISVKSKPNHLN